MKTKMMCLMLLSALSVSAFAEQPGIKKAVVKRFANANITVTKYFEKPNPKTGVYERTNETVCSEDVQVPVFETNPGDGSTTMDLEKYAFKCESKVSGVPVIVMVTPMITEGNLAENKAHGAEAFDGAAIKYFNAWMGVGLKSADAINKDAASFTKENLAEIKKRTRIADALQKSSVNGAAIIGSSPSMAIVSMMPSDQDCAGGNWTVCYGREKFQSQVLFMDKQ